MKRCTCDATKRDSYLSDKPPVKPAAVPPGGTPSGASSALPARPECLVLLGELGVVTERLEVGA